MRQASSTESVNLARRIDAWPTPDRVWVTAEGRGRPAARTKAGATAPLAASSRTHVDRSRWTDVERCPVLGRGAAISIGTLLAAATRVPPSRHPPHAGLGLLANPVGPTPPHPHGGGRRDGRAHRGARRGARAAAAAVRRRRGGRVARADPRRGLRHLRRQQREAGLPARQADRVGGVGGVLGWELGCCGPPAVPIPGFA